MEHWVPRCMMLPAYDPKSSLQCRRIIHFVLREVTILDFKSRRRPGRIKSAINRVHHSQTRNILLKTFWISFWKLKRVLMSASFANKILLGRQNFYAKKLVIIIILKNALVALTNYFAHPCLFVPSIFTIIPLNKTEHAWDVSAQRINIKAGREAKDAPVSSF